MTIYWERCSICGNYNLVKQCTIYQDVIVCPHCCLSCVKRRECSKPVWFPEIKLFAKREAIPGKRREAEKVFMELLGMLGEEEKS